MARIIEEELPKPIGMLLSYPVIDISPSASISRYEINELYNDNMYLSIIIGWHLVMIQF